ncbi:MAG: hypothetical protein U1E36_01520 [Rickettsiales bacterium]
MPSNEIYIETIRVGNYVKVTAIDAVSGKEVVFMAAHDAPRKSIEELAIKKLRYVEQKKK